MGEDGDTGDTVPVPTVVELAGIGGFEEVGLR